MSHALLSPSSAHRWLVCTPSARLESRVADKTSSYAEEGSTAHALAELKLKQLYKGMRKSEFNREYKHIKGSEHYSESMEEYTDIYVAYIVDIYSSYEKEGKKPCVFVEQLGEIHEYVPEGFGTSDCVIIADDELTIVDLKYGRGVLVTAEGNPQTRLYALAMYNLFGRIYDLKTVHMHIVQPRVADGISSATMSVKDLLHWAETEVKPKAQLAYKGEGERVATDEACKFCKIKHECATRARRFADVIDEVKYLKSELEGKDTITPSDKALILKESEGLAEYLAEIKESALTDLLNGEDVEGYKAVEGRSLRTYKDKDEVIYELKTEGFSDDVIFDKSLKSITKLEKEIGKKKLASILGDLIIKPQGKPTIVPISDKRKPYESQKINVNEIFKED